LGDLLYLGKGEELCQGRGKPSILANTMEALLGAIYLDAGFDQTLKIIHRLFTPLLDRVGSRVLPNDFKSLLQEYTQKEFKMLPTYRLIEERGPAHNKTFAVELSLDGKTLATEEGKSKKEAEQKAAGKAYYCLLEKSDH
jgi:ribonuclease-3